MGDRTTPGRYVHERILGRGGMATVYLARDLALDRLVALKVLAEHLAADEALRDRFVREARLAARLVHPNVVQIYDVGEDERGPFIVMEYVEGETLAAELGRRGRLPADEVVAVGIQLCSGLEAAHFAGLVHRDIKPQNVLRRPDGQVKVADFGIARSLTGTGQTEIGTVLGTAAYLAPEQARGEPVTAAADLYSLGVLLYELLTGQTPFTADTLTELLVKREEQPVVLPSALAPDVPPGVEAAVMRCLARRPEDRPTSAAALAHELATSIGEPATEALPVPTSLRATELLPPIAAAQRRRWLPFAAGAAALLALGGSLAFVLADSGKSRHVAANTTRLTSATPTTTTPAIAARTTTVTSTTATTNVQPPPATPQQAIASSRAAIYRAETSGLLDDAAAADLNHRLDDIAQSLGREKSKDAAHKIADLLSRLSDLAGQGGQLSSGGLAQITAPLNRLAAFLPATDTRKPAGHSKEKHGKKGGD